MRTNVSTFRVQVEVGDVQEERFVQQAAWVDTGALFSQFPASLLESLGHRPRLTRTFVLADGSRVERPIGSVPLRLRGEVMPVACVYGEEGSEVLLGATALENFTLAVDPVHETLVPVTGMML